MKKLIPVSSFFALFILLLAGCQNSSDITSPDTNLDKKPVPPTYTYSCDPTELSSGGTVTVDLVAGQHNPVGTATFTFDSGDLHISYNLNERSWDNFRDTYRFCHSFK